jgi:TolB-like protein
MSVAVRRLTYEFGEFRLDPAEHLLVDRRHEPIPLTPRAYDLLLHFLEHPRELLGKKALLKAIWPNTVVEENNLSQHVSALRHALGGERNGGPYIVTVHRRGYRFVAHVQVTELPSDPCSEIMRVSTVPRPMDHTGASVAVLPFLNLGGDPAQEYFGEGLADEVIHLLSRVSGLAVAARTSSFCYRGRNVQIQTIARELRVATVLEGSVRWSGQRFRITVQLVSATSGYQMWSQSFDRSFEDVFRVQGEIASAIVEAIRSHMHVALHLPAVPMPPTQDLDAYRLYLQGAALAVLGAEAGIRRGIVLLQQAVQRDPQFARAIAALAIRRVGLIYLHARAEVVREIEQEAECALALDATLGEAHTALGMLNVIRRRWFDAHAQFRAAHALGASDPVEVVQAQYLAASVGKIRLANQHVRQAHELSPADPVLLGVLAVATLALSAESATTDAAARYADLAMNLGMHGNAGPLPIVRLYVALRRHQKSEAIDAAHDVVQQLIPDFAEAGVRAITVLQAAVSDAEHRLSALDALNNLLAVLEPPRIGPVLAIQIVAWYTMLGALNQAYEFAHRAIDYAQRSDTMGLLLTWLWHPELYPFRRDARFEPFVARLAMLEFWEVYGPPDGCELCDGRLIVT